MIWHHPSICEIDILLKLNSNHLRIDLYDSANQPIPHAIAMCIFMVAEYINSIADLIMLFAIRSAGEENIRQFASLFAFHQPQAFDEKSMMNNQT